MVTRQITRTRLLLWAMGLLLLATLLLWATAPAHAQQVYRTEPPPVCTQTCPAGPAGPAGPVGPQGPAGPAAVTLSCPTVPERDLTLAADFTAVGYTETADCGAYALLVTASGTGALVDLRAWRAQLLPGLAMGHRITSITASPRDPLFIVYGAADGFWARRWPIASLAWVALP